ncbi:MAG: glycogen/starch synthase [Candidatus Margulisiibacteriota bacterium]
MKILFVSSEVVPFAKTGGLADVAGALPKAIRKLGHDIRVFMPLYKKVDRENGGSSL